MDSLCFSIVVPTFNRAQLLDVCLHSLLNQTYKNFEVLVCDDGSTDNTRDIVKKYDKKLNVKYHHERNWGGPARPRNNGIKLAKGEWICFLDSDDEYDPNKLETVYEYTMDYDFIYHNCRILNGRKATKRVIKSRQIKNDRRVFEILTRAQIINSSVCVRRSHMIAVNGFSEDKHLIAVEDADCWIRLALMDTRFKHLSEVLGSYRVFDNISANDKFYEKYLNLIEKYANMLNDDELGISERNKKYIRGMVYQRNNEMLKAIRQYRQSISHEDIMLSLKAIYRIILSLQGKKRF